MEIEDSNSEAGKKHQHTHSLSISGDSAFTKIGQIKPNSVMKKESLSENMSVSSLQTVHVRHPPSISDHISIESDLSGKARQNMQNADLFEKFNNEGMQAPPLLNPYRMSYRQDHEESTNSPYISKHSASPTLLPPAMQKEPELSVVQEDENQINMIIESSIEEAKSQSSSQKTSTPGQTPPNLKCKCVRSKCIQLYCECFSRGVICNEACQCRQCKNNLQHKDKLDKAKNAALEKNPEAFTGKIIEEGNDHLINKRGCNCKKTLCFKKYCQCFLAGVRCSQLCKCDNCLNGGEHAYQQ